MRSSGGSRKGRAGSSRGALSAARNGTSSPPALLRAARAGAAGAGRGGEEAEERTGLGDAAAPLPERAAERGARRDPDAEELRALGALAGDHGEAVRDRPRLGAQAERMVHEVLDEDQVFRIDHFLGKEAAQNILALRFANGLFEPIWNRNHIDHIQIDVPETLGVGSRAAFYEKTGAFRDMVVTHLFQILAFVAMEPPTSLAPDPITDEKNKVFRSLQPLDPSQVVRGQYEGYRDEEGVDPNSSTETFVALRCELDNWRWSGVPFYLRTGKRMGESSRIISIAFREPPQAMFPSTRGSAATAPTTSPSTSTSPRASRSPSTASGRGWGWCSTRRACSSHSTKPATAATRSRPTSG